MRIKFEAHFVFVSINAFRFSQPSRFVLRDLQWKGYHWVDYFYTLFVFFLLVKLYNYIMKSRLSVFFVKLGNYSYEVFLFQMLVFSLISEKRFFFIENEVFRNIVYVLTTIVFSIVPVLVYKEYIKKLYVR